ncbi:hypothetical protein [Lacticaseibacillus saniviri]
MATIQLDLQENQALASNNFVKLNVGEENISWRFRLSRGNVPYNLTGSTVTFRVSGVNHKPITGGKYQPVDVQNGLFDWVFPVEMTQMSSGMYGFSDAQFMIRNGDVLDSSGNFVIRVAPTPGVIENYKGTIDEIDQMIQSSLNTIGDIQSSYQKVEADISKKLTDVGPVIDEFQNKLLTMTAEFNEAITKSTQATEKANLAALNADTAMTAANTAADKATASAIAADKATGTANDATDKAIAAAKSADDAAANANKEAASASKAAANAQSMADDIKENPDKYRGPEGPVGPTGEKGDKGDKGDPGTVENLDETVAKAVAPIDDRVTDVETKQKSQQAILDGMSTTIANEVKPAKELAESLAGRMTAVEASAANAQSMADDVNGLKTRVSAIEKSGVGNASIWSGNSSAAYDALSADDKAKYSLYTIEE